MISAVSPLMHHLLDGSGPPSGVASLRSVARTAYRANPHVRHGGYEFADRRAACGRAHRPASQGFRMGGSGQGPGEPDAARRRRPRGRHGEAARASGLCPLRGQARRGCHRGQARGDDVVRRGVAVGSLRHRPAARRPAPRAHPRRPPAVRLRGVGLRGARHQQLRPGATSAEGFHVSPGRRRSLGRSATPRSTRQRPPGAHGSGACRRRSRRG